MVPTGLSTWPITKLGSDCRVGDLSRSAKQADAVFRTSARTRLCVRMSTRSRQAGKTGKTVETRQEAGHRS